MGFLLVFDVTNHSSFNLLAEVAVRIHLMKETTAVPIVVAGNECHKHNREVTRQEAEEFSKSINAPYIEISTTENINMELVFHTLACVVAKDLTPTTNAKTLRRASKLPLAKVEPANAKEEEFVVRTNMKLMVLGSGQIGKTTLVHYLKYCNKSLLQVQ